MIGGGNPVVVQSMVKTDPQDLQQTLGQLRDLKRVGCEVAAVALAHEDICRSIPFLKKEVEMPIVGDVLFNHAIALKAMELGIDGVLINPGVIGNARKVKEVAIAARESRIPVCIAIDIGSLEKRIQKKYQTPNAAAVVESALYHARLLEDAGHAAIGISLKASGTLETVEAYRRISDASDYPLCLHLPEGGPLFSGVIRSSAGLAILLNEGVGDTIRVSLTGNPVQEVAAAFHLLRGLGLRKRGVNIVSCPTCCKCRVDLRGIVAEFEKETSHIDTYLNVAIMGCEANGPGEAREADIGIAFGAQRATLFGKGSVRKTGIRLELAKGVLLEEIANLSR